MNQSDKNIVNMKPWSKEWFKAKYHGLKLCLEEHSLSYTLKLAFEQFAEYSKFGRVTYNICTAIRRSMLISIIELPVRYLISVKGGLSVYEKMLSFDGVSDNDIYFMDYAGTGDAYLTCSCLHMKGLDKDAIFVGSGISRRIAQNFDFTYAHGIKQKQGYKVHIMRRFLADREKLQLKPLVYENSTIDYSGVMCACEGLNGIDFLTMLRIGMSCNAGLTFEQDFVFRHPEFRYNKDELNEYIKARQLPKGKTVILSPYANTGNTFGIPWSEWEELAKQLKQKGYTVCTNTSQKNGEKNITDTIPVFLKHEMMPAFCEYAGHFIGLRSGLCDIISGAEMETFVTVTPPYKVGITQYPMSEFFSLVKMGGGNNIINIDSQLEFDMLKKNLL